MTSYRWPQSTASSATFTSDTVTRNAPSTFPTVPSTIASALSAVPASRAVFPRRAKAELRETTCSPVIPARVVVRSVAIPSPR